MVSFISRVHQINATQNQTRINLVSYQRRNRLLILKFVFGRKEFLDFFGSEG